MVPSRPRYDPNAMPDAHPPEPTKPIEGRTEKHSHETYTSTRIHVDRPCRPYVAAPGQQPRCDENRGGDFYTACNDCIVCDVPHQQAPEVMAYVIHPDDPKRASSHCVFTRPPRTPAEIEHAI